MSRAMSYTAFHDATRAVPRLNSLERVQLHQSASSADNLGTSITLADLGSNQTTAEAWMTLWVT
jgi:hypothetical protein